MFKLLLHSLANYSVTIIICIHIHKAKMVRKEREKYNSNVVSKTSDKERQELNRIQNELLSILAESGN